MNTILQVQNEPKQLDRLAAQRQLYADAKRILAVQMLSTAVVSVTLAFLSVKYPQVRIWGALWGLVFIFVDLFCLAPYQKSLKKTASAIQEMFDCDVLALPWKRGREKIEAEDVAKAAKRHKNRIGQARFLDNFGNWYSVGVASVPLYQARIICQRSNIRWDVELRGRYNFVLWCFIGLLVLGAACYGLAHNLPAQEVLTTVFLPLQPLLVLAARQIQENREAIDTLNRLKRTVKKLWDDAVSGKDPDALTQGSRDLQDELWDQRSKTPLIFDWVYNRLKRGDEEAMNIGTTALIEEAQKANQP